MKQLSIGLAIGLSVSAALAIPHSDKDFLWQAITELREKVATIHHDQQRLELRIVGLEKRAHGAAARDQLHQKELDKLNGINQ